MQQEPFLTVRTVVAKTSVGFAFPAPLAGAAPHVDPAVRVVTFTVTVALARYVLI